MSFDFDAQGSLIVLLLVDEIREGVKKQLMKVAEAEVDARIKELLPDLHVMAEEFFDQERMRDEVRVLIDFKPRGASRD